MTPVLVVQVKNTSTVMANLAKSVLHVAVGVIVRQQHVLLALRKASQHQGGKWEFPGGKLEQGELTEHALVRELAEEIGITVQASSPLLQLRYHYPEREVFLDIRLVTEFSGEPQGLEGQAVKWFAISELDTITLPDANQPIVEHLQQHFL